MPQDQNVVATKQCVEVCFILPRTSHYRARVYDTNSLCFFSFALGFVDWFLFSVRLIWLAWHHVLSLHSLTYFLWSGLSTHLHLGISEMCKIIWFGNSKSKYFCTAFKNKKNLQCYALNSYPRLSICPKYTCEFHKLL